MKDEGMRKLIRSEAQVKTGFPKKKISFSVTRRQCRVTGEKCLFFSSIIGKCAGQENDGKAAKKRGMKWDGVWRDGRWRWMEDGDVASWTKR